MSFTARRRSSCDECIHPIEPGQEAMYNPDNEVVHLICPQERPRPTCPHCWMELPANGKCDCRE